MVTEEGYLGVEIGTRFGDPMESEREIKLRERAGTYGHSLRKFTTYLTITSCGTCDAQMVGLDAVDAHFNEQEKQIMQNWMNSPPPQVQESVGAGA